MQRGRKRNLKKTSVKSKLNTLLSAMEHASSDDMPEDAEHKEIGTPATRAGVIEVTGNEAAHGRW